MTFAKQGVGLVEEKNPVFVFCLIEQPRQVFLGLANILGYHPREVDPENILTRLLSQQCNGAGFAGAGRSVKQGAVAGSGFLLHAPTVLYGIGIGNPVFDFLNLP